MTIGTECPHCESVFQVGAELVGKAMRCPNPTCREVFTVEPTGDATPASPPPVPVSRPVPVPTAESSGDVSEFLSVFDAEPVAAPTMTFSAIPTPPKPVADSAPVPTELHDAEPINARTAPRPAPPPPVQKATPLPPAPPTQRAPQVLDWSEVGAKQPPGKPTRRPAGRDDDSHIPIRTRRRRNPLAVFVLIAMVVLLLGSIGGTVYYFVLGGFRNEEQDVAAAEKLYTDGKYAEAKRKYDALTADYPSSQAVDKYRFFSALSDTQAAIGSVTVKEDPAPALRSLTGFIAAHGESPYAQPNSGFGGDVVVAGQKLCNAIGDHALERVKKFQAKPTDMSQLDAADSAIADGRGLIPKLEKFRDKSGLSFDDVKKKFDDAAAGVKGQRDRLAALAPWRDLAIDPTDRRIDEFEKAMKAAGLGKDGEALALSAAAKAELRRLADEYHPEAVAAGPPPAEMTKTLTAAPRVAGSPEVKFPTGKKDAVFGIARGVLYAVDVRTGEKLWAERVSDDGRAADPPLRVTLPNDTADWVLVPSVRGGRAALTARNVLTGEAAWQQELPAQALGKPARVGGRLIVPLADELGTLVELDLRSGDRIGTVQLRQPIGGGVAAIRGLNSGHAFLVVPADARRVFVFEVGRLGDDGKRKSPRVTRVFATFHPHDSLRGAPLVIDPDNSTVPRRVILTQADGPAEMKLRSFTLPPVTELGQPSPDGDIDPPQMAEATVGGWSWFPPLSDGERVAVCSDTGVFAAFGINLPGQADKPLYQLPGKGADADPTATTRCQVVSMDDDSFWVVVSGKLTRLRVSADPRGGMKIIPAPDSRPVGEPVSAAQVRPADGLAVITTRMADAGPIQLHAFDTASGEVRWTRQLGVTAVARPFPLPDGSRLVVDRCGGVYRTPADGTGLQLVDNCEPKAVAVSPAVAAADGSRVWVAVHEPSPDGMKLAVRILLNGKPEGDERVVSVPAGLAGKAVAVGDHLLLPLANGFLYRLGLKDTQMTQGPAWRGARAKADAVCHLTGSADGQFVYGDGDIQVFRRRWASDKPEAEKADGPWETAGPLSGPAVTLRSDKKEWLVAADVFGVAVFDPAKPSSDPVRRWQGAAEGKLPAGTGSHVTVFGERVAWAVGGRAVAAAAPSNDQPDWVFPLPADVGEVVALSASSDGLLVTCSAGVVLELSASGEVRAEAAPAALGPITTHGTTRIGDSEVLITLADGTVSRLALRKR